MDSRSQIKFWMSKLFNNSIIREGQKRREVVVGTTPQVSATWLNLMGTRLWTPWRWLQIVESFKAQGPLRTSLSQWIEIRSQDFLQGPLSVLWWLSRRQWKIKSKISHLTSLRGYRLPNTIINRPCLAIIKLRQGILILLRNLNKTHWELCKETL